MRFTNPQHLRFSVMKPLLLEAYFILPKFKILLAVHLYNSSYPITSICRGLPRPFNERGSLIPLFMKLRTAVLQRGVQQAGRSVGEHAKEMHSKKPFSFRQFPFIFPFRNLCSSWVPPAVPPPLSFLLFPAVPTRYPALALWCSPARSVCPYPYSVANAADKGLSSVCSAHGGCAAHVPPAGRFLQDFRS